MGKHQQQNTQCSWKQTTRIVCTVEPHYYYSHLWAKHFWLLYRAGCFTEVQKYRITSLGTWTVAVILRWLLNGVTTILRFHGTRTTQTQQCIHTMDKCRSVLGSNTLPLLVRLTNSSGMGEGEPANCSTLPDQCTGSVWDHRGSVREARYMYSYRYC